MIEAAKREGILIRVVDARRSARFERGEGRRERQTGILPAIEKPRGIMAAGLLCFPSKSTRYERGNRLPLPFAARLQTPRLEAKMARRYTYSASSPKKSETPSSFPAASLARLVEMYLMDCEVSQHSERTVEGRRFMLGKFVWWVQEVARPEGIGTDEVKRFLHYLTNGHKEKGGRWGNTRETKPNTSGTVKTYYSALRTFFNWCVKEEEVSPSPMDRIDPPVNRPDQVQPFTDEQLHALQLAARGSRVGARDEAIFCIFLDTGIRLAELCSLTIADCDLQSRQIWVREGKGGKSRMVPFSQEAKRKIWAYLRTRDFTGLAPTDPLFATDRGAREGEPMRRLAVLWTVYRWCEKAGINRERRGPHTFRHSFAVKFLRAGGDVFSLQVMLGHTSLSMTSRYVSLAKADVTRQHAQFSPLESLKKGGRR